MKHQRDNFNVFIFLVILSSVILTSATDTSVASEFRVNQFTNFPPGEAAEDPAIAIDSHNHFIITWEDPRIGIDNVFARIFDSSGSPLTNDFRVDQDRIASDPSIAVDRQDHVIITWEKTIGQVFEHDDIFARIFDSTGAPLTNEFRVDQDSGTNEAGEPVIATDSTSNFIIAWTDDRNGNTDIFADVRSSATGGSGVGLIWMAMDRMILCGETPIAGWWPSG